MKICDYLRTQEPTFENKLMYAMFTSSYDCYSESKFGYLDGARYALEDSNYKELDELREYAKEYEKSNKPLSEYDKAYLLAIKDYIKQEESKWKK